MYQVVPSEDWLPPNQSIKTVHRHFNLVLYAVGELRSEIIKPPIPGIHLKILGSHRWQVTINLTVKP